MKRKPVGESAACSVMETTLMPLRWSRDLKATAQQLVIYTFNLRGELAITTGQ